MIIHLMYQLLIVIAMLIIGSLLNVDIAVVITLVSSVSVLSIIVIFIICGLLCGHRLSKRPTISQSSVCEDGLTADTSPTGPVYENLTSLTNDFKAEKHCDNEKSNINLNTNMSYAPLPIVTK